MPTATIQSNSQIGGLSIAGTVSRSGDGQLGFEIALPAGESFYMGTRTDDNTGVFTLAGHSLSNGDVVDVFWSGGMRYGMTAIVSGDDVTLDGGTGDVLPVQGTTCVLAEQVEVNADFDGDDVQAIVVGCDQRASLDFQDSGDASLQHVELETANEPWSWFADQGVANPLTGNATDAIHCSNGSTTAATLKIGVVYDSTP